MSVKVKICGINDKVAMEAAIEAGAAFVGLVFYPPSPRYLTVEKASDLASMVPHSIPAVGLFVDPKDDLLREVKKSVALKMIQLHGDETKERIEGIKKLTGLPVMKAIKIATEDDLKAVPSYEDVVDYLLFDAKISDSILPGGNAVAFDWSILKDRHFKKPWMLAGGLNISNLERAVHITGAQIIDVSSGVEDRPGHKNPDKIRELIRFAGQF